MFGSSDQLALYGDRTLGPISLRTSPYSSDPELDPYLAPVLIERHRRPSAVVLKLQDPLLKCNKNLGWNIDWAVAFIVNHIQTAGLADAFRQVRKRAVELERDGLLEEVPYRIFNKLDEILFAGHLRNAVYLDINDLDMDVSGITSTHGWGPEKEVKRISIIINSSVSSYGTAKDMVATLIHHMIHAYFLVACGPQKDDEVSYGRLGHGIHFGTILLAIKKLSSVHGKELTTLSFRHRSQNTRRLADFYSRHERTDVEHVNSEEWYCSHCDDQVQELSENEVDRWYDKVCKPMADQHKSVREPNVLIYNDRRGELELKQRSQLMPSAKSVELILGEKLVQVESRKIDEFHSVRKAFDRAHSRYLKIDRSTSEATFLRLLEFLHTGSYRPDLSHFAALSSGMGMGRRSPPVIKPQISSTDTPLLADVEFARFASLMGFDECRQYALDRMNVYGIIYEDPINVLTAIYHGREPDPHLKAWARKFLVQVPTRTLPGHHFSTAEPPNLLKLEQESGSYRARFLDALEGSGALENDVNKARAELKALGWYNWSSHPHHSSPYGSDSPTALTLGYPRPPSLLTDGLPSPPLPWPNSSAPIAGLSYADVQRLHDFERFKQMEKSRKLDRVMERDKSRELEVTRARLRELERERTQERERSAGDQKAAYLDRYYDSRRGGFVEDDY